MSDINLSVEKLKSAIQLEATIPDWDYAKCYLEVMSNQSFGGGAIYLYKNDNTELLRFILKNHSEIWFPVAEFMRSQKKNKYNLTIYPNGEHESSFIWDEVAHLDYLAKKVEGWLVGAGREAGYRVQDKCDILGIDWDFETEVVVSFTADSSNPVLFITENKPEMTFSLYFEQMFFYIETDYTEAFEEFGKNRQKVEGDMITDFENWYFMMNEGELKGHYPRWNVAIFVVKPAFEPSFQDIKFEWREDLA